MIKETNDCLFTGYIWEFYTKCFQLGILSLLTSGTLSLKIVDIMVIFNLKKIPITIEFIYLNYIAYIPHSCLVLK